MALAKLYLLIANIQVCRTQLKLRWNNRYVFKEQEEEHRVWWKTLAKTFFAYAGIGLILSNILLVICVRVLSIHEMLAPILILFVTTPVNFLVNKLWAYRGKNDG